MKRRRLKQKIFLALPGVVLLTATALSCESVECPLNNTVYSTYRFYAIQDGKETSITVLDTLTVRANGTDSILINRLNNGSEVKLPVSYSAPVDTLIFHFIDQDQNAREDTIWIEKDNYPHYESPACPVSMFHHVKSVKYTQVLIDSVTIANPNINYNASENFKIYFRTAN